MSVREVYFHVVLADVRVDPSEDIFREGQEDHILVYHEITVVLR